MTNFTNSRKGKQLKALSKIVGLKGKDDLTKRSKFNFSYFVPGQNGTGQDFKDWDHEQLVKLLNKLKNYSREELLYWKTQMIKGLPVLAVYGNFPESTKTDFTVPSNIPHDVQWGRFRLERTVRLIGFVVPGEFHKSEHSDTKELFDKNTFYVVFLDRDHKFYKPEED